MLETAVSSGFLQQPGALAATELQLALHAAAPKIRAYYQFYDDHNFSIDNDCESWVDWYGERVCDLETLRRLASQESIESLDMPLNSSTSYVSIILL